MLMTTSTDAPTPSTVVIVADDPVVRAYVRNSMLDSPYYVFDCKVDDLRSIVRAFRIDAVVFVGERTGIELAKLREGLAAAKIPARRIAMVATAGEAHAAVRRALDA